MAEEKSNSKRKKPNFIRKDWHKKVKLGSTVKKLRKWRAPKGRHNKIRLGRKGHISRPSIGWGSDNKFKGKIDNLNVVRVENISSLENVEKGFAIIIAKVGKKKREEIIKKASEMKIRIINRYKKVDLK